VERFVHALAVVENQPQFIVTPREKTRAGEDMHAAILHAKDLR